MFIINNGEFKITVDLFTDLMKIVDEYEKSDIHYSVTTKSGQLTRPPYYKIKGHKQYKYWKV